MKKNKINLLFFGAVTFFLAIVVNPCGVAEADRYDSYGRRDPFVPLVGVPDSGHVSGVQGVLTIDDVSLQGILVGNDGARSVIINGEIMKEGDRVARVFIESIGENVVTIHIDDVEYEVKLYE